MFLWIGGAVALLVAGFYLGWYSGTVIMGGLVSEKLESGELVAVSKR